LDGSSVGLLIDELLESLRDEESALLDVSLVGIASLDIAHWHTMRTERGRGEMR
jgi:hypothetical protein